MRFFQVVAAVSLAAAPLLCNATPPELAAPEDGKQLRIGGYSSAGVQIHPGGYAEAALNKLSLIFNWDGLNRLRLFAELELEKPLTWHENANITTGNAYFDVERLYADYSLNSALNVRAGRFLTPIGRWNLLHAAPLVWTSIRPAATARLFPMAVNGVMLHGSRSWGDAAVEYSAYVEVVPDQTDDPDEIPFRDTRGLRLAYSDLAEVGLSLAEFQNEIPGHPRYHMLGVDFLKVWKGWEFSGEAYLRERTGRGENGSGGYLQGVAPLGGHWYAIGRLETLSEPGRGSTGRWLVGAAWRQTPARVFKIEYTGGPDDNPDMPRGLMASFAILF